jgi:hypothetical protein
MQFKDVILQPYYDKIKYYSHVNQGIKCLSSINMNGIIYDCLSYFLTRNNELSIYHFAPTK